MDKIIRTNIILSEDSDTTVAGCWLSSMFSRSRDFNRMYYETNAAISCIRADRLLGKDDSAYMREIADRAEKNAWKVRLVAETLTSLIGQHRVGLTPSLNKAMHQAQKSSNGLIDVSGKAMNVNGIGQIKVAWAELKNCCHFCLADHVAHELLRLSNDSRDTFQIIQMGMDYLKYLEHHGIKINFEPIRFTILAQFEPVKMLLPVMTEQGKLTLLNYEAPKRSDKAKRKRALRARNNRSQW